MLNIYILEGFDKITQQVGSVRTKQELFPILHCHKDNLPLHPPLLPLSDTISIAAAHKITVILPQV